MSVLLILLGIFDFSLIQGSSFICLSALTIVLIPFRCQIPFLSNPIILPLPIHLKINQQNPHNSKNRIKSHPIIFSNFDIKFLTSLQTYHQKMLSRVLNSTWRNFAVTKEVNWSLKSRGAVLRLQMFPPETVLLYVTPEFKFGHLLESLGLSENDLKLPSSLTLQSSVFDFLQNFEDPQEVQITFPTTVAKLKNKAIQSDSVEIANVVSDPNSLYGAIRKFQQIKKPNTISQLNNFIIQYYLKMHGLHYMRVHNLPLKTKMTANLKFEIFQHIKIFYEQNIMKQLRQYMNEEIRVKQQIALQENAIRSLKNSIDARLAWYKAGAVIVTATHITSFGYMIFFVDWLGWDIIEPITYTVAVIYALLGIRFFRKHQTDRNQHNVKWMLRTLFSSPEQRAHLKQLQARLSRLKGEQKTYTQETTLLRNRLRFQTSLASAL